jgi:gliding motility-associated-like protein
VKSVGSYSAPGFINPILNLSEEQCAVPIDSVAPCPAALEVHNTCNTTDFALGGFVNQLIWSYPDPGCAADIFYYLIYYAFAANVPLQLIDTLRDVTSNTFTHFLANTIAGCYAIAGVDSNLNVGDLSNTVCVDNCPVYVLPNVFTPNNDGHNDFYHPFLPIQFVDRVDMKIFDQWGDMVYSTTDPMLGHATQPNGWNGKDQRTGKDLPEAVYYYVCDVYNGQQKIGPTLSGYIQLFR